MKQNMLKSHQTVLRTGSANQGSFYYSKDLSTEIGTTGRYLVSADVQYVSGGGMTFNLVTGHNDKNLGGTESLNLFTIGFGRCDNCRR